MKLATLKNLNQKDGTLIVVSADNRLAVSAQGVVSSLREAIENWGQFRPTLESLYQKLNSSPPSDAFPVQFKTLTAPLPRTWAWIDGSAYIQHIKLVRKARGASLPETLETIPLVYQGGSDTFLGPLESIPQEDISHGTDFEAELGVIVNEVPMGVTADQALNHIILFVLINDVSLRGLIPEELKRGFGFFQSKPSSSLSPFTVTVDELGEYWRGGRVHLPLEVDYNGQSFGRACAGEMHFHFGELIAHCARTRKLSAGTLIGSGTVSNVDTANGCSCIAEKRMLEKINTGSIQTSFMKAGDRVQIQMLKPDGHNIFGSICQHVVSWKADI